jgi:hypothetical protein
LKGYDGLNGVELVVHRGGKANEVIDLVDLEQEGLDDVMPDELKFGVPKVVHHVLFPPREEVIHDDHVVPLLNQTVHEM